MTDQNRSIREDIIETPEGTSVVRSEVSTSATSGAPGNAAMPGQAEVLQVRTQHSTTVIPNEGERQRRRLERIKQFTTFLFGALSALLIMRFVLQLLGANEENAFAHFIYRVSYPFVAPFLGLFGRQAQYGASVLEIEAIVALGVYAFIGWGLLKLWALIFQPGDGRHHPMA